MKESAFLFKAIRAVCPLLAVATSALASGCASVRTVSSLEARVSLLESILEGKDPSAEIHNLLNPSIPRIDGRVECVIDDGGGVLVDKGYDDGVRLGIPIMIAREGRLLGLARVTAVDRKACLCRFYAYPDEAMKAQVGDRAETHL